MDPPVHNVVTCRLSGIIIYHFISTYPITLRVYGHFIFLESEFGSIPKKEWIKSVEFSIFGVGTLGIIPKCGAPRQVAPPP